MNHIVHMIALLLLIACGTAKQQSMVERIEGSWTSTIGTITFEPTKYTFVGVGITKDVNYTKRLDILSEESNILIISGADDEPTTVQILDERRIIMKEGDDGIPVIFERAD